MKVFFLYFFNYFSFIRFSRERERKRERVVKKRGRERGRGRGSVVIMKNLYFDFFLFCEIFKC